MKRGVLFSSVLLFMVMFCIQASASSGKLYRNRDWQFSIYVPVNFEYVVPRGPNTKMQAMDKYGNSMSIVVKQVPVLTDAQSDDLVVGQLNEFVNYSKQRNGRIVLEAGIIDVSNHKAIYLVTENIFKGTNIKVRYFGYSFYLITMGKEYTIMYSTLPQMAEQYKPIFIKSISSFVDETGWYL